MEKRNEYTSSKLMKPDVFVGKAVESLQSFDPGLIIRGVQLTWVGAYRALQNPNLFQSEHYRQALIAVLAGLAVRFIVDLPILFVKVVLFFCGLFMDLKSASWDDKIISGISFVEKTVLQIPFFLMTYASSHLTSALDDLFMESLAWVDQTYMRKHANDDPSRTRKLYYENLKLWNKGSKSNSPDQRQKSAKKDFLNKSLRKGMISLLVYFSSLTPVIGKLVLPAASAYSLKGPAGIGPAIVVFLTGLFVPRKYMVLLLQAYYASRSLTRQLLEPYFCRVTFTSADRKKWFRDREGLLFGFGLGFYFLLRTPLLGVLIYGIAEASTAYLITKITDPPPRPEDGKNYAASQAKWRSKHNFMRLSLNNLDHYSENDPNQPDLNETAPSFEGQAKLRQTRPSSSA